MCHRASLMTRSMQVAFAAPPTKMFFFVIQMLFILVMEQQIGPLTLPQKLTQLDLSDIRPCQVSIQFFTFLYVPLY